MEPTVLERRIGTMPVIPTWIGVCCREWTLAAIGIGPGRCGICGGTPVYLRPGPDVGGVRNDATRG